MRRRPFALWRFAVRLYKQPKAASACLALQDRHGADVNLLIYCCWVGLSEAAPLARHRMEEILASVALWQRDVIVPLRGLRRRLKRAEFDAGQAATFRQQIAEFELDAEYLELRMLAAASRRPIRHRPAGAADRVQANVSAYLACIGVHGSVDHHIRFLCSAALHAGKTQRRGAGRC